MDQKTLRILMFLAVLSQAGCAATEPTYAADINQTNTEWYAGLMQPDNPYLSCCGEADAYFSDSYEVSGDQYVAIITDERPDERRDEFGRRITRPHIPVGTRVPIPNGKIKFDKGNPIGHGIVFIGHSLISTNGAVGNGGVFCYLPPGGV